MNGLVAYLTQSRYGKLGNELYSGTNKEVYQNKSNEYITGCSYGSPSNGNANYGCQYTYDMSIMEEGTNGKGGLGIGASTIGNIYGIYDMSGGAWEYVMVNYNDKVGGSGFSSMPEGKYYDKYTTDNALTACNGGECLSHALSETAGWYSDAQTMISNTYQWMMRGGGCNYYANVGAGVFSFLYNNTKGSANGSSSFRLVMSGS